MHYLRILTAIVFLGISIWAKQSSADTLSVLFIGNSYTYYHNMPDMVRQIARSNGDSLYQSSFTIGGNNWYNCLNQPNQRTQILALINSRKWDAIVLQEQSQLGALGPDVGPVNSYDNADSFCQLIYKISPWSRIYFYMTWGRQFGDPSNSASYPFMATYQGMQASLRRHYLTFGQRKADTTTNSPNINFTSVAPVGVVWSRVFTESPQIGLYATDGSHPSLTGSYLIASTFYLSLFQRPIRSRPTNLAIPIDHASLIEDISRQVVLDSLSQWRINARPRASDLVGKVYVNDWQWARLLKEARYPIDSFGYLDTSINATTSLSRVAAIGGTRNLRGRNIELTQPIYHLSQIRHLSRLKDLCLENQQLDTLPTIWPDSLLNLELKSVGPKEFSYWPRNLRRLNLAGSRMHNVSTVWPNSLAYLNLEAGLNIDSLGTGAAGVSWPWPPSVDTLIMSNNPFSTLRLDSTASTMYLDVSNTGLLIRNGLPRELATFRWVGNPDSCFYHLPTSLNHVSPEPRLCRPVSVSAAAQHILPWSYNFSLGEITINQSGNCTVYTSDGRLVQQYVNCMPGFRISLASSPRGVYIISLTNPINQWKTSLAR